MSQGLHGVRKAAKERRQERFTALLHHLNVGLLRDSFHALKRQASPGVDGVRWQEYEVGLEDRLVDLHSRVHRGTYRAQPSRRVYIPKADGRQRPLGVGALEDKIVQQAVVTILNYMCWDITNTTLCPVTSTSCASSNVASTVCGEMYWCAAVSALRSGGTALRPSWNGGSLHPAFCTLILKHAFTPLILRKSCMRRRARTDLSGGRSVMSVPTGTVSRPGIGLRPVRRPMFRMADHTCGTPSTGF